MRNFEEIKAEVFRRSENRIRERKKKRNRILACCIPLCLCIVILAVLYMPQFKFINDKNNYIEIEYENEICTEDSDGASQFAYTSLEITNDTTSSVSSRKENDVEKVEKIYNTIHSCFDIIYGDTQNNGGIATEGNSNTGENHGNSSVSGESSGTRIKIIFSTDDGTQSVYTIDENLLTNETTKQTIVLTNSQLLELKKALE